MAVEEGLKETKAKVKKEQDIDYKQLRGLHIDSQSSQQGKVIIGVAIMQKYLSNFIDDLIGIASGHQNKVPKLQKLGGCVHVAMEELQDQLGIFKDLAQENSKWFLRYTNVHVHRDEEIIPIIVVAKAYRTKAEKGKKVK